MQEILIIGAGMAATALAKSLAGQARLSLVEKSRGMGGRMSTRRSDAFQFDHGAQFLTARSEEFKAFTAEALDKGWLAPWEPRVTTLEVGAANYKREWFEPHFVATPSMNGLCKAQLRELESQHGEHFKIALGTQVAKIVRGDSGQWQVFDSLENSLGSYDIVISTAPPRQTEALFQDCGFSETPALAHAEHLPCFSLMLGFDTDLQLPFDLAVVKNSCVALIANDGTKPGRSSARSLLVHADNAWARANLEEPSEQVEERLLTETLSLTGLSEASISYRSLHRWRYAKTEKALEREFLLDREEGLAACGDWCLGGTVESAYLSGYRLGVALRSETSASAARSRG